MTKQKRFRKGQLTPEVLGIILDDLDSIQFENTYDNKYYHDLVRGNIIDVFGRRVYQKWMKKNGED